MTSKVKIGVQLPEVERVVRWPEIEQMAIAAEAGGLDSLWVGDHYQYGHGDNVRGPWEAWTQLAALAAVTERITLGPFVASLTFHNPAVIAKMASTVDEIAGGRLMLGVGAGWNQTEYRAFGFPYERRVDRFEEAFGVVRRLLAGDEVSLDGEFIRLESCVLHPPTSDGRVVPLMIGSSGRRMLDITLPHVAAWNAWFVDYDNQPDQVGRAMRPLLDACERIGRDPNSIEKSVALLVDFGSTEPRAHSINPVRGGRQQIADAIHTLSDAGIDHVQLVLDPITEATIEESAEVACLVRA